MYAAAASGVKPVRIDLQRGKCGVEHQGEKVLTERRLQAGFRRRPRCSRLARSCRVLEQNNNISMCTLRLAAPSVPAAVSPLTHALALAPAATARPTLVRILLPQCVYARDSLMRRLRCKEETNTHYTGCSLCPATRTQVSDVHLSEAQQHIPTRRRVTVLCGLW